MGTNDSKMLPKVREWLEARGFTLEMRTASAFRAAGFDVRQSSVYTDTDTGKPRETDVLANDPDYIGVINIRFIVECKTTKKPWVILSSPYTLVGYNRVFAFAAVSKRVKELFFERVGEMLEKFAWLRKEVLAGYSVREAFSDSADTAYAAAAAVATACTNFVSGRDGKYTSVLCFAFPVIVIDGPLIQCTFGKDGEVQLEEVEQGEFLFFLGSFGTCIRVVTASYLGTFTVEAKQVANDLRAAFKADEQQIVDSWKNI